GSLLHQPAHRHPARLPGGGAAIIRRAAPRAPGGDSRRGRQDAGALRRDGAPPGQRAPREPLRQAGHEARAGVAGVPRSVLRGGAARARGRRRRGELAAAPERGARLARRLPRRAGVAATRALIDTRRATCTRILREGSMTTRSAAAVAFLFLAPPGVQAAEPRAEEQPVAPSQIPAPALQTLDSNAGTHRVHGYTERTFPSGGQTY